MLDLRFRLLHLFFLISGMCVWFPSTSSAMTREELAAIAMKITEETKKPIQTLIVEGEFIDSYFFSTRYCEHPESPKLHVSLDRIQDGTTAAPKPIPEEEFKSPFGLMIEIKAELKAEIVEKIVVALIKAYENFTLEFPVPEEVHVVVSEKLAALTVWGNTIYLPVLDPAHLTPLFFHELGHVTFNEIFGHQHMKVSSESEGLGYFTMQSLVESFTSSVQMDYRLSSAQFLGIWMSDFLAPPKPRKSFKARFTSLWMSARKHSVEESRFFSAMEEAFANLIVRHFVVDIAQLTRASNVLSPGKDPFNPELYNAQGRCLDQAFAIETLENWSTNEWCAHHSSNVYFGLFHDIFSKVEVQNLDLIELGSGIAQFELRQLLSLAPNSLNQTQNSLLSKIMKNIIEKKDRQGVELRNHIQTCLMNRGFDLSLGL